MTKVYRPTHCPEGHSIEWVDTEFGFCLLEYVHQQPYRRFWWKFTPIAGQWALQKIGEYTG